MELDVLDLVEHRRELVLLCAGGVRVYTRPLASVLLPVPPDADEAWGAALAARADADVRARVRRENVCPRALCPCGRALPSPYVLGSSPCLRHLREECDGGDRVAWFGGFETARTTTLHQPEPRRLARLHLAGAHYLRFLPDADGALGAVPEGDLAFSDATGVRALSRVRLARPFELGPRRYLVADAADFEVLPGVSEARHAVSFFHVALHPETGRVVSAALDGDAFGGTEDEILVALCARITLADPDVLVGWDVGPQLHRLVAAHPDAARAFTRTDEPLAVLTVVRPSLGEVCLVRSPGRWIVDERLAADDRAYVNCFGLLDVAAADGVSETEPTAILRALTEKHATPRALAVRAHLTGVPPRLMQGRGAEVMVQSMLRRHARELGLHLPRRHPAHLLRADGKLEGGHVPAPVLGEHAGPVAALDFRSMYPSIIIAYNLDSSTARRDGSFVARDVQEGVGPRMLADLMRRRGDPATDAVAAREIKLLMNKYYGNTACATSASYFPAVSAATTAAGRRILVQVIETLHAWGHAVLYGHTDSVFVHLGLPATAGSVDAEAAARALADRLNAAGIYPAPVLIRVDRVFRALNVYAVNRYAFLDVHDRFGAKGMDAHPEVVRAALLESLERRMRGLGDAVGVVGAGPLRLFLVSRMLNKPADEYAAHDEHARVARDWPAADAANRPRVGRAVLYFYAASGPVAACDVSPPDAARYARMLAAELERVGGGARVQRRAGPLAKRGKAAPPPDTLSREDALRLFS